MQNFTNDDFLLTGSPAPKVNKRRNAQVILAYLHGYSFQKISFLFSFLAQCFVRVLELVTWRE